MKTYLIAVRDALAGLTDLELYALIVATKEAPKIAPSLLAWVKGVCDWEINRRLCRNFAPLPPEATIDPNEAVIIVEATYAMRASFANSDFAPAVLKFFDALVELFTGRRPEAVAPESARVERAQSDSNRRV
jgi:hypothetical protein